MNKRLLLISNSTNPNESYLSYTEKHIKAFLGEELRRVAFLPYASVDMPWVEYTNRVSEVFGKLNYSVKSTDDMVGAEKVLEQAEAIVIGGGNTFHLLHMMQQKKLMDIIREKVESGTPFIGWSAGSNVACPNIKTTNDMPIIQPESFDALHLVPFQINPHYTDARVPNHNGETREERIREFLEINPDNIVLGLKEGSMIKIENQTAKLLGNKTVKIFRKDVPTLEYDSNASLDFILK